jgi:hypothetical protein
VNNFTLSPVTLSAAEGSIRSRSFGVAQDDKPQRYFFPSLFAEPKQALSVLSVFLRRFLRVWVNEAEYLSV